MGRGRRLIRRQRGTTAHRSTVGRADALPPKRYTGASAVIASAIDEAMQRRRDGIQKQIDFWSRPGYGDDPIDAALRHDDIAERAEGKRRRPRD